MMKTTKKAAALLTAVLLILTFSVTALAQPRLEIIQRATPTITISGTKASCKLVVKGVTGTDSIEADIRVIDENGNEKASWSASSSSATLSSSKSVTVKAGVTYTLEADVTVYCDGDSESRYVSTETTA